MFPPLPRPSRRFLIIASSILLPFFIEVLLHWRKFNVPKPSTQDVDPPFHAGCLEPDVQAEGERENAALVMLARNGDLDDVRHTINSVEDRFNRWFHYPYVFLNDEPVSYFPREGFCEVFMRPKVSSLESLICASWTLLRLSESPPQIFADLMR